MVITPEQARYHEGTDRDASIRGLAEMIALRSRGHFTRAKVVPGNAVPWTSDAVAPVLRTVVDHCIARGAYKPFNGVTVGHFAARGATPQEILTSRRKTDFNKLPETGLVRVESTGVDNVTAYGAKPSVGGMSQRMIFAEHPDRMSLALDQEGIDCRPLIAGSMELQPFWTKRTGRDAGVCSNARLVHKHGLYVPNHQSMELEDVRRVCEAVLGTLGPRGRSGHVGLVGPTMTDLE